MLELLLASLLQITTGACGPGCVISGVLTHYSYLGIFILMVLESASLPVPSEVVLPAIGYFAARGYLSLSGGIFVAILGSMVGIAIDYYIAYFVGKAFAYKWLMKLNVKRSTLEAFDAWFARNGSFAVFISREIPVVRGLISFPAGFAQMPKMKFFSYSLAGTVIWDVLLALFGYYALNTNNITYIVAAVAGLVVVLHLVYTYAIRSINSKKN